LLVTTGVVDGATAEVASDAGALEIGMTKVGVSEMVALPELGGATVALLGAAGDRVDSEAGTPLEAVVEGVTVGAEDMPEPGMPPEGTSPEEVSIGVGVAPEDTALGGTVGVSLGSRGVRDESEGEGVGTAPDGVGTPEGMIPEGTEADEISDAMLETMSLAVGRATGTVALGGKSDTKLEIMLGMTEVGRSGTAEGKRLETSETNEDTSGGRTPEAVGTGDSETGAVGPAEPEGSTPVTSETREDKIEGRSSGPEGTTASEVGIALEATGVGVVAPVPNAVVIPTTMPPEDGCTSRGCSLDGTAGAIVGSAMLLGRTPVGDASGTPRRVERRPPTRPWDCVGVAMEDGMPPPVEPGTINGPWKLDATGGDGSGIATGAELAGIMTSGTGPVDPTR
jgi:hypothetical protein